MKDVRKIPIKADHKYYACRKGKIYRRLRGRRLRELKPMLSQSYCHTYHKVQIKINGRFKNRYVHRLVCLAFKGKPAFDKKICRHKGSTLDNRPEMLQWGSWIDNNRHDRMRDGTYWVRSRKFEKDPF